MVSKENPNARCHTFSLLKAKFKDNYIQQNNSWEASSSSTSQQIQRILCNPKFHIHFHNSQPLVPIMSQFNPLHILSTGVLRSTLVLSPHLRRGLPNKLFPSSFSIKTLHEPPASPQVSHATTISPCSHLHFPVTSSLSGPNILLSTLFSKTLSLCSFLNVTNPYLSQTKKKLKKKSLKNRALKF